MPSSCVLIAATNHQSLLDPAVWRRFVQKVEVELPEDEEILTLMSVFSENYKTNFANDKQKTQSLVKVFQGLSPSDIKTIYDKAKVKSIISGNNAIDYCQLLFGVFELKNNDNTESSMVHFLSENGMSQVAIHDSFGISLRKIKGFMSEK